MSCMCGDICCSSCGPAQGNWRCIVCRSWANEGCEHIKEDGSGYKPEFDNVSEEQIRREQEEIDKYYRLERELEKYEEGTEL